MKAITKIRRSIRAISPVISVLLMIAVAVAASLVAYAWIMGYMGGTTTKVGKAVLIQSMAKNDADDKLIVYVQNVGRGAVTIDSVYVKDVLTPFTTADAALDEGETAELKVEYVVTSDERITVKVVTSDGTFTQTTGGAGGSTQILPAALDSFEFNTIGDQAAGAPFSVTITAIDQYGNPFTGYIGTNTLDFSAGTVTPTSTTAFVGGVWTGDVTVSPAGIGVTISTSGAGKSGTSNSFNVGAAPAALHHFNFDTISSPQTTGTPFSITIRAIDQYGAAFTSYTGTNTLTYSAGAISPTTTTGGFTAGVWTGLVTVTGSGTGVTIDTAAQSDPIKTGTSNTFNVNSPVTVTLLSDGFEEKWDSSTDLYRSTDQKHAGSYSMKSDYDDEDDLDSYYINAQGASSITVTFWYRHTSISDYDLELYYYDGSGWDNPANLGDDGSDNTWVQYTQTITDSQYFDSTFRIRFNTNLGSGEEVWVDDVSVTVTGGPGTTFTDNFEQADPNWYDNWDANSPNDWDLSTDQMHAGSISAGSYDYRDGYLTCDNLDTSNALSITIDFWYRLDDTETDDLILYYYNGATYVEITRLGGDTEDTWIHYQQTIADSQYFKSNFRIRFYTDGGGGLSSDENIWIDDVLITKSVLP